MDLFRLIKNDHRKVQGLFNKLKVTSERAVKTREKLRNQLAAEIELHAVVEEKQLYPVLRKHRETKDLVPEALAEHKEAKELLKKLRKTAAGDAEFLTTLKELEKGIKHHVQEEENEILPAAAQALSEEEANQIAERIKEMKDDAAGKKAA